MSKNEIIVKIEGIGGFKKKPTTEIKLKQGITVINASNAVGKSSFVRALQLLCAGNNLNLEDMLNEYETSGSVEMQNDKKSYIQILKTADGKVKIASSKLMWDDLRAINLGFCVPDSPLVQIIKEHNQKDFKRWMRDISGANHYENAIKIITTLLRESEYEKEGLEEVMKSVELEDVEKKIYEAQDKKLEIDQELAKAEKKMNKLGASAEKEKYEKLKKSLEEKTEERNKLSDERNKKTAELNRNIKKQDEIVKDKLIIQNEMITYENELEVRNREEVEINKRKNEINLKIYGEKTGVLAQLVALKTSSEKDQAAIDNLKSHGEDEAVIGECIILLRRRLDEERQHIKELEEEKAKFESELKEFSSQLSDTKRIGREIQSKRRELLAINKTAINLEKVIPSLKSRISTLSKQIATIDEEINEIDGDMKRNIERVKDMSDDLKDSMIRLQKESRELSKSLQELEKDRIEKLEAQEKYQEIVIIVEKLEKFLAYMQDRYNYIIYGVIEHLNKELKEIFKIMEYTDFIKIRIKDEPEIDIELTRKDGIITKASRLSTSEQLTLAIIIMFVAKQAYAPDLPVFVIDEVMGSYDKTRFDRILKYILDKVPYLVVTSQTPLEKTGKNLVIEYSLT